MGLNINVIDKVAGTTFVPTLVNSGATISPLSFQLFSGSGTLVNSCAAVASGNGYYYGTQLLPNSEAWYVSQAIAVMNANTYVLRQVVRARAVEVS